MFDFLCTLLSLVYVYDFVPCLTCSNLQGLDLSDVLVEVEKRGSSFDKLLAVPEQDDWIYSDGKSTSCIAFILEMYKEAGLFGSSANSIQVTEFTVREPNTHGLSFYHSFLTVLS